LLEDLCVVLPVAADPGVGDVALQVGAELLAALGTPAALRLLVTPGRVDRTGESLEVAPDPLQAALDQSPPALGPGLHLTARKAQRLELARRVTPAGSYRGASLPPIPLFRAGAVAPGAVPWRSAEMLRVSAAYVPRPTVDAALAVLHEVPVAVVQGGLGVGKTRAVHHALGAHRTLWVTLRPARHRGPSLGAQLAWGLAAGGSEAAPWARELGFDGSGRWLEPGGAPPQLGDPELLGHLFPGWLRRAPGGAPVVVCDGLEGTAEEDGRLLSRLARSAEAGHFRLVLVGRGPLPAVVTAGRWPVVEVPPLGGDESEALARGVTARLGLPARRFEALLSQAAGCPFAFEEGLAALAELGLLVERDGGLRYRGPDDGEFVPSDRFVRHVEAEVARLADPWALRLLALNEGAIPDDRLSVATAGGGPRREWVADALEAGLVAPAESPWGAAVDVPCPAVRAAIRRTVVPGSVGPLLLELGRSLSAAASPRDAWRTYPMPKGTEEGSGAALETAAGDAVPTAELVPALAAELGAERTRGIAPEAELQRLWTLLPMARRVGVLETYRGELVRALTLAAGDPVKRFALAGLKAELEEDSGRFEEAVETLHGALRAAEGATEQGRAVLVLRLGRLLVRLHRIDEARELLDRVVPALDAAGATSLAASGRFLRAEIARHLHQLDEARQLHLEALAVRRKVGAAKPIGASLSALGGVELRAGRTTEALERFREAEEIYRRVGDEEEAASALLGIGQAFTRLGNFVGATTPLRRALELQRERGDEGGEALVRLHLAENLLDLGRPREALAEARQARFGLELHSMRGALAHAEQLLGRIALAQRKPTEARSHFLAARDAHLALESREQAATDVSWLVVLAAERDPDEDVAARVRELKAALLACPEAERRDLLEYRLYLGLERLWRVSEARGHLERAYQALLAKTEYLPVELRNSFLSQIPDHQQLMAAATKVLGERI
jgi:tetratricopeptide (TPR) repeat protein